MTGGSAGAHTGRQRSRAWGWLREVLVVVGIALLLSFLIKTFLFRAFYIPSGSMEPTLEINDRIFVNLMEPGPFALERGDVVVFRDELDWLGPVPEEQTGPVREALAFVGLLPEQGQQHLVKRVIGLPGDTVVCCDDSGRITVNGTPIEEPYLWPGAAPSDLEFRTTVPEGKLWVMGDHRNASADSRFHRDTQGGFIDVGSVEGTVAVIAWPPSRMGWVDGHHEVFEDVPGPSATGGS